MTMTNYRKLIVSAVVAVAIAGLTALQSAYGDGVMTAQEWITVGLAVVGALGVWLVPNKPAVDGKYDMGANPDHP